MCLLITPNQHLLQSDGLSLCLLAAPQAPTLSLSPQGTCPVRLLAATQNPAAHVDTCCPDSPLSFLPTRPPAPTLGALEP